MKFKNLTSCLSLLIGSLLFNSLAIAQSYLPEQRAPWCKNAVMNYQDTDRADITILSESDFSVSWRVKSTNKTGKCYFNNKNEFVNLETTNSELDYEITGNIYWDSSANAYIAHDGAVCHTCNPANGFPIPPITLDGFFYLPNEGQWFDPKGELCATCTGASQI